MKRFVPITFCALAACGAGVKRVAIEPAQAMMATRGASLILHAEPRDEKGQPVPDVQIAWSSGNPAVASVDAAGKVTAVKSGTAVVTAVAGHIQGTATIKVSIPALLTLSPRQIELTGSGQLEAIHMVAKDDVGTVISGMPGFWTSSNSNVASVNNQGIVHALAAGEATITVRTGPLSATTKVTVALPRFDKLSIGPKGPLKLKVGQGQQLTLAATLAGQPVAGVSAKWTCDAEKVAMVSPVGQLTAVKKGRATVFATAGDKTSKLVVVVK